jgi:hypothetical protein
VTKEERFILDYSNGLCAVAEICRLYGIAGNADYPYSDPLRQERA